MNKLYALPATAAVLALALPAGVATAAEPEPSLDQDARALCGAAELTLTNDTDGDYTWHARIGANSGEGEVRTEDFTVPAGETLTVPVRLDEGSYGGSAYVAYGTVSGPERDLYQPFATVAVDTDCAPPADDDEDEGQGETPPPADEGGSGDEGSGDEGSGETPGRDEDAGDTDEGDTGSGGYVEVRPGGSYPVGGIETGGGPA